MFQNSPPPPPGFVLNAPPAGPAPSGGGLRRITPEKQPDPYQVQKDERSASMEAERLRLSQESAAREATKFGREESKLAATGGVDATESERTAAFLATRVADSVNKLRQYEGSRPSLGVEAVRSLPIVGETAANYLTKEDRQIVEANQLDFLDAALTLGTGAAYTKEQLQGYRKSYFPQLGDSDATIKEKQRKLDVLLESARVKAGAAAPMIEKALSSLGEPEAGQLPTAVGAKADPGLGPTGVTAKGGLRYEKGLGGLPDQVANMIAEGRESSEIVSFLNEQYKPFNAEVGPDLAGTIGGLVSKHRANPRAPAKSLGTGWESFSMLPADQETSVMGEIADTAPGNLLMHTANAATAGLPAALAGEQGEAVMSASREARPVSSMTGDVIGSTAAMMGINRAAGAAGRAGEALTRGGGIGGDMFYGAARGASEGGAEGAVIGALGAGAGNVIGRTVIAPAVRLGASGAARAAGSSIPSVTRAEGRVARYLPEEAPAMLDEAASTNTPMMLADTSPKMRALAGSVSRRSPEAYEVAENALRPRALGQADRAMEAIETNLGGVDNPIEVSEALMKKASDDAAPLYEAFRAQPARSSPKLKALLDRPAGKAALTRAQEIAADEGVDPKTWGIDLNELGELAVVQDLSPQTLDYIKRGLDDVVEAKGNRNAITGKLEMGEGGRAVNRLRKDFIREVDALYPQYKEARAAYAGPAAAREALAEGQRMANARPRNIERRMRDLKGDELEQFRLGLRIGLADKVLGRSDRSNPFEPIYGSPDQRARLGMSSPQGSGGLGSVYDMEGKMAATANEVMGNSATARRQAADRVFENRMSDVGDAGIAVLTGAGAPGIGRAVGQGVADRYRAGFSEKLAKELAPILFNDDPAAGAAFIRELIARAEKTDRFKKGASRIGGAIGAGLGTGAAVQ